MSKPFSIDWWEDVQYNISIAVTISVLLDKDEDYQKYNEMFDWVGSRLERKYD